MFRLAAVLLLAASCVSTPEPSLDFAAAEKLGAADFIKWSDTVGLQMAVVSLEAEGQPDLDLIGAIHVADPHFYRALNRKMSDYDAVFFELVMPDPSGSRKKPESDWWQDYIAEVKKTLSQYLPVDKIIGRGNKNSPFVVYLTKVQKMVRDMLQLGFQLEHLTHDGEQFVHADVTLGQLADRYGKQAQGRSTIEMALSNFNGLRRAHSAGSSQGASSTFGATLNLLREVRDGVLDLEAEGYAVKMRRFYGKRLVASMEASLLHLKDFTAVIVEFRNEKALQVVSQHLTERDDLERIAILYGAIHMPDMFRRLHEMYGYRRVKTQWLTAWDLRPR